MRYLDTSKSVGRVTIPDFVETLGNIHEVLFETPAIEQNQMHSYNTVSTG